MVEIWDDCQNCKGRYKWNPNRLKSKEKSLCHVLLLKSWRESKAEEENCLTMTLRFDSGEGMKKWTSVSLDMVDKLEGIRPVRTAHLENSEQTEEETQNWFNHIEIGKYTIVSSKVDWVSFWSHLKERVAKKTLIPVNSIVQVTQVRAEKDSRGNFRTRCKVVHLFYPQFSELTEDEVPKPKAEGWIKGIYLANHINSPMQDFSEGEMIGQYREEVLMMKEAFKRLQNNLSVHDRTLLLRAVKVTLQHVVINPYRPRKLRKSNSRHTNLFLHESGSSLLAIVGFEPRGNDELFLPSLVAKTDLANMILSKISKEAKQDLDFQRSAPAQDVVVAKSIHSVPSEMSVVVTSTQIKPAEIFVEGDVPVNLNLRGTNFQTTRKELSLCTKLCLEKLMRLASGEYFLDKDPGLFRHILDYLRTNSQVPRGDRTFLVNLWREAQYYGIYPLMEDIEKKMNSQ